ANLTVSVDERDLLRSTNVSMPAGRITVLVGGSGAGKSVLLRVMAGLLPRKGETIRWLGDVSLVGPHPPDATPRVGIVFQQFALFDELSPLGNVQFALDHRASFRDQEPDHDNETAPESNDQESLDRREHQQQSAQQWLDELGVPANVPVAGLSGGQKQRLAIARTLAADPDVVFYDEPTSGLDAASGRKVAELIRKTQTLHRRTSVVVTHDYETLIPIADEVIFLDAVSKQLVSVPKNQWDTIATRMQMVSTDDSADMNSRSQTTGVPTTGASTTGASKHDGPSMTLRKWMAPLDAFLVGTGRAVHALLCLPFDARPSFPSLRWAIRFWLHYLRLVGGPSAWLYLSLAGLIAGFTTTFFTFRFLPFRLYTQPLLIDELLASVGFALYRILVPVLATILIAARCGAAVAADVGVKQYGGQVDAMKTLGVRAPAYLLIPILLAFLVATPALEWLAFTAARSVSLLTFHSSHQSIPTHFWHQNFFRNLTPDENSVAGVWLCRGWYWVWAKNALCGVGTAVISYHQGLRPKHSAGDVSAAITSTVLWTTLFVLVVHFVIALFEF
ncbi:MAG: ABC transporter permease, partial [Planctomycetota bacterium]